MQQEQKIFRIGVIGVPAPFKNLRISLAYLVLKTVVVRATNYQLNVEFMELLAHPVETGFIFSTASGDVKIQYQGHTRSGVHPTRIPSLGQQLPGNFNGLALRPPVDPVVYHGINAFLAFAVTENSRRNGSLGR